MRLLLLAGTLGAIGLSAAQATWKAHLVQGTKTWLMDRGEHPVWQPPPNPDYQEFKEHFKTIEDFPPSDGRWSISVGYDLSDVAFTAAVYLWPILFVCGLLNCGRDRDVILHCALSMAHGLTVAAVVCVVLWCMTGGRKSPLPACIAYMGIAIGIARGLLSYRPNE